MSCSRRLSKAVDRLWGVYAVPLPSCARSEFVELIPQLLDEGIDSARCRLRVTTALYRAYLDGLERRSILVWDEVPPG